MRRRAASLIEIMVPYPGCRPGPVFWPELNWLKEKISTQEYPYKQYSKYIKEKLFNRTKWGARGPAAEPI